MTEQLTYTPEQIKEMEMKLRLVKKMLNDPGNKIQEAYRLVLDPEYVQQVIATARRTK